LAEKAIDPGGDVWRERLGGSGLEGDGERGAG